MHRLYANSKSFFISDVSIHDFGILVGIKNAPESMSYFTDTLGQLVHPSTFHDKSCCIDQDSHHCSSCKFSYIVWHLKITEHFFF